MRTKVYAFKPKGKLYKVYVTKTIHGKSKSSKSRRSSGAAADCISGLIANVVVRSIFGRKK